MSQKTHEDHMLYTSQYFNHKNQNTGIKIGLPEE